MKDKQFMREEISGYRFYFKVGIFLISAVLCVNLFIGFEMYAAAERVRTPSDSDEAYKQITIFMQVLEVLRSNYVDADKVTYERLIKGALKGMLHSLDPYSSYEDINKFKKTIEKTEGKYEGLGVMLGIKDSHLTIFYTLPEGPAEKAGIHAGDIITKINGTEVKGKSFNECVKLLKKPAGTTIKLTIYRKSTNATKEFTVVTAEVSNSGVRAAKMLTEYIGYIRITQFVANTASELNKSIKKLRKKGMKSLIIDLRGNPGGLLTSAIEVCSLFLETGKLIVFTKGRRDDQTRKYFSVPCDKYLKVPLIILADNYSASAAEIVSGCLQDYKRAIILGVQTFGKGSVQTLLELPNKSAIRFTTAKYYTPSEKVINHVGIIPDIELPLDSKKLAARLRRQLVNYPGVIKPDIKNAVKDIQLKRAVEILKGVYLFSKKM